MQNPTAAANNRQLTSVAIATAAQLSRKPHAASAHARGCQLGSGRRRHHGGLQSARAVRLTESDGPVFGRDPGSYRYREVQAGNRDRKAASGRNNQR